MTAAKITYTCNYNNEAYTFTVTNNNHNISVVIRLMM